MFPKDQGALYISRIIPVTCWYLMGGCPSSLSPKPFIPQAVIEKWPKINFPPLPAVTKLVSIARGWSFTDPL